MTGISDSKIAFATISSLKAQRSSNDPPPLPHIIVSQSPFSFTSLIALAISSAAPSP